MKVIKDGGHRLFEHDAESGAVVSEMLSRLERELPDVPIGDRPGAIAFQIGYRGNVGVGHERRSLLAVVIGSGW